MAEFGSFDPKNLGRPNTVVPGFRVLGFRVLGFGALLRFRAQNPGDRAWSVYKTLLIWI